MPLSLAGGGVADAAKGYALAGLVIEEEEERGGFGDEDLSVVAVRGELFGAVKQRLVKLVGVLDGAAQGAGAHGVELAGGGVDDDETLRSEDACDEVAEGRSQRGRGAVGVRG